MQILFSDERSAIFDHLDRTSDHEIAFAAGRGPSVALSGQGQSRFRALYGISQPLSPPTIRTMARS
jgi:hypothetical protein